MSVNLTNLLIDIEDQRHYNSCGGQAGSTYLEAIWKKFTGEDREFSAAFLWRMAILESGRVGNAPVTYAAIFNVLTKYGCCLEADYPSNDENLNRFPTPEEIKKAKPYRIAKYEVIDITKVNAYLDKGLPVFTFMDFSGGHFVNTFGYTPETRLIVNSWGVEWMDHGTQWMHNVEYEKRFKKAVVITKLPLTTRFAKMFNKLVRLIPLK